MDLFLYIVLILAAIALFLIVIFRIHRKRQLARLQQKLDEKREEISGAVTSFRSILDSEYYISKAECSDWHAAWNYLRPLVQQYNQKHIKTGFDNELKTLKSAFENGATLIKKKNEEYIQHELQKYQDFFDAVRSILLPRVRGVQ